MGVRKKILIFLLLFGFAVLINISALVFLARSVLTSLETIDRVGIHQQLAAVGMQAGLRDAEAALYRYLMEGEAGFADQFHSQIENFRKEVEAYQTLASTPEELGWARDLKNAQAQATNLGDQLIQLHDQQEADIASLEQETSSVSDLLSGQMLPARPDDFRYQQVVQELHDDAREMLLAVSTYLVSPQESSHVRFTEAAVSFQSNAERYREMATSPQEQGWSEDVDATFAEIQQLGSQLISNRSLQQALFASFTATVYEAGQETVVGKIQPQAAERLDQAQQKLFRAASISVLISLVVPILMAILTGILALRLLGQLDRGIRELLRGADRVAAGELDLPVQLEGEDELHRLSDAFNTMMVNLSNRERRLKARLAELETLRQVSLQMTGTLDTRQVLKTIAANALKLVGATEVSIFTPAQSGDPGRGDLRPAASICRDQENRNHNLRADSLTSLVASTGQLHVVNWVDGHQAFEPQAAISRGVKSSAGFPLRQGDLVLGVLQVSFDDRQSVAHEEQRILNLLADQAAVALGNARLYEELAQQENQLRNLVQQMSQIQDEERRLIGLDLHDGLTQLVISANMHFNTLAALLAESGRQDGSAELGSINAVNDRINQEILEELELGRARLKQAIQEARRVISELRPSVLEDHGLAEGLRMYALQICQEKNWKLAYESNLDSLKISPPVEAALFRIAQEAISNSRKYSNTQQLSVSLGQSGDALVLCVEDYGQGFDLQALTGVQDHLGLVSMQERATLLGGKFQIFSQPNQGTRVQVSIPLSSLQASKVQVPAIREAY